MATMATNIDVGTAVIRFRVDMARDATRELEAQYPEALAAIRASVALRMVGHRIRSRVLMNPDVVLSDGRDRED